MFRIGLLIAVIVSISDQSATARDIYVDSRTGNDAFDGSSGTPVNAWVGPVRSLGRAMQLVGVGDSLILVDNGTPYYGSLTFFGPKFSGTTTTPFRLVGNGAVISGTKPIHPDSWTDVGGDLFRFTPVRKGHYQLVKEGAALTEVDLPWHPSQLPNFSRGSWGAYQGRIYYKAEPAENPRYGEFHLAQAGTGLTLLGVENVVITDVTFRHFRIDGINAHDRCDNILLSGVICEENGRAGLCVGGTSRVLMRDSLVTGNSHHSLLITELGEAEVQTTDFDRPPTVTE